ncbi:endonuclease/exonuclease/phosphatase family protein [Sphingomonas sp. GB1N7]|uniref:endonuclease/exonuclease/phosphatase family protein n=1 Tax=Parasphingomonas caseinilytica TaxID=3096158 RepID=UPI002FCA3078
MRTVALIALATMMSIPAGGLARVPLAPGRPDGDAVFSVLTYNVKGLPWPVAVGRPADLAAIADRLRAMRVRHEAPQIVVLQEAFTADAQAIGRAAGYRYIVDGPAARTSGRSNRHDALSAGARWWKGETEGKVVGSGLQVLSDYPITDVRRMAFPPETCAGYDCLANKGAVIVRITIPGGATPIEIVTTHLNCRKASGVADERSDAAYAAQADLMTRFVQYARDPRYPLIVAGDFNVGHAQARRRSLFRAIAQRWSSAGAVTDALGEARRRGLPMDPDAIASWRHAKDLQIFASGSAAKLDLIGIAVPFGHDRAGAMLSDHIGYVARYRFSIVRTPGRSTA